MSKTMILYENVLNFIEKAIKKQCFRMKMLIISTKILKKFVKNYEFVWKCIGFDRKNKKKQCFRMKMLIISTKILKKWVKNYEFVWKSIDLLYIYIFRRICRLTGKLPVGKIPVGAWPMLSVIFFFSQAQKCIPVCDYFEPLYGQAPTSNHFWRPDPVSLILRD